MVERVAAALRRRAAEIEGRPGVAAADVMFHGAEFARAVIAEMREPTEAMVEAGHAWSLEAEYPGSGATASCWRAMIDAALGE